MWRGLTQAGSTVRTLAEAKAVTELLAENGLKRGDNGLKHIMMCELPTNALLADRYLGAQEQEDL